VAGGRSPAAGVRCVRPDTGALPQRSSDNKHHLVNRAPVLTLWATIVAERLGYSRATALTLGRKRPRFMPVQRTPTGSTRHLLRSQRLAKR